MSVLTRPPIVTSGLVLHLDAANKKSYPGSGTTWFDLSGNNNSGSLVNGPVYSPTQGGGIVFDGINDFISIPSITWTPTASTVNWFTLGNTVSNFNQNILATNGWNAFVFHTDGQGSIYVGTDVATRLTPSNIPNNTYVLNVYQNFTFTYGNGIGSLFKNSILLASKSMTAPVAWTGFNIGSDTINTTINGRIANTQIYNRALSSDEVLQNYNATKGRFGL
jgi:hypothetical protein